MLSSWTSMRLCEGGREGGGGGKLCLRGHSQDDKRLNMWSRSYVVQVVSGWNNGSVTVRHGETGEVVFKDSMGAGGVAGIVVSDYRLTGTPDVLVVSTGEGGGERVGCL